MPRGGALHTRCHTRCCEACTNRRIRTCPMAAAPSSSDMLLRRRSARSSSVCRSSSPTAWHARTEQPTLCSVRLRSAACAGSQNRQQAQPGVTHAECRCEVAGGKEAWRCGAGCHPAAKHRWVVIATMQETCGVSRQRRRAQAVSRAACLASEGCGACAHALLAQRVVAQVQGAAQGIRVEHEGCADRAAGQALFL